MTQTGNRSKNFLDLPTKLLYNSLQTKTARKCHGATKAKLICRIHIQCFLKYVKVEEEGRLHRLTAAEQKSYLFILIPDNYLIRQSNNLDNIEVSANLWGRFPWPSRFCLTWYEANGNSWQ